MEEYLRVGVISNTHGIKGEVKVFPTTDNLERFGYLKEALIDTRKELKAVEVTGVKYFKNMVILKFKGIDNINDVEKYKGMDLLVTRENAVPLEEGEYYICDLIDCEVYEDNGNKLGVLADVLTTAANDVYVVKMENNKEVLIPVIDDCIKEVDIDNRKVTVHLLKGMLD